MEQYRKTIRIGAFVIVCAVLLRLIGNGFFSPLIELLAKPNIQSFLIYLETGRNVRFSPSFAENEKLDEPEQTASSEEIPTQAQVSLRFCAEDADAIEVKYNCDYRPSLALLLTQPLSWSLRADEPTVLIVHTHTTESYTATPDEQYEPSSDYRTLDEAYNMLSIGDRVAEILEQNGIAVVHDRDLHDYPSYNGSYDNARASIETYLSQYPGIRLVLDLHRDAAGDATHQLRTCVSVDGIDCAQLLFVMGTDASGTSHPNWEENLALALKLHTILERETPGIMRPISLRPTRFNQDLSTGALLVEVGAAGNTHSEALRAAERLADAIVCLADGYDG